MKRGVWAGLIVLGVASIATAGELLPAPYQVAGVEYGLAALSGAEGPLVRVDLGAVEGKPFPRRERFERMTIVGTSGAAPGFLHDIQKVCVYLCGDEIEECHYIGRVSATRSLEEIGTPVAAIPGAHEVEGFRALAGAEPVGSLNLLPEWLARDFEKPIWPTGSDSLTGYRLRKPITADRELRLEYHWSGGEVYPVEDRGCRMRQLEDLTEVACPSFALITQQGRPLLVSLADYNDPAAETVASFDHGGMRYRVVRLGLKAQTVFGLLVETEEGWRALIRPRDYALLC